ncbi:ethanolamine ammonia-lyase subunit EutC [Glaciimonas sp. GNP009]
MTKPTVITNPWQLLRQFTSARIALGRAGISLPTAVQLDFQLAHARARDAVHQMLDTEKVAQALTDCGVSQQNACVTLSSVAQTRDSYLQRPDFGRKLSPSSHQILEALSAPLKDSTTIKTHTSQRHVDLAFVIADGLSALAIEQNAATFLATLMPLLKAGNWSTAPFTIVRQGRVAIGDEIGELLGAKMVVVLIGERPGLSSPDSLGIYLTWQPHVGLTDESRNCISNIRPAGLSYPDAAGKLHYLLSEAFSRQLTGISLKDGTINDPTLKPASRNFLIEKE